MQRASFPVFNLQLTTVKVLSLHTLKNKKTWILCVVEKSNRALVNLIVDQKIVSLSIVYGIFVIIMFVS
jgi:hypothetical protein